MSSDSTQPRRRSSPVRDGRGRRSDHPEGPTASRPTGYGVFLLLLLAVGVLCVAGFFVVRVLFSEPQPAPLPASFTRTDQPPTVSPGSQATGAGGTPGTAQTAINPQQGYINTLVTVMGQGWWPGEPVFIFLRSRAEGNGSGYAYAAAVADDWGKLRAAFTFPNEMRWINEEWADVIARGTRSGMEARTRFALVVPTPTNTVPVPTPRPTLPHTDTPWPTDTPAVLPSPTPEVIISDWLGEYFANPTLAGDPVHIRNDVSIDFNWGANSPEPGIPDDQFSARWTRQQFFQDRFYRFTVRSDDGVRLWIDGRLAVDEWHDGTLTPYSVDLYLAQGQHPLRLEYYENVGGAMIQLTWVQIEAPTTTPSPTTTSTPKPTDTATPTPTTTDTPLPTALPTDTPTRGPTATDTPLPTAVPTDTATPTPTPTDTASPTPVPSDTPSATPSPTRPLPGAWRAEFFTNRFLAGLPAIIRQDAEVSFDWRDGSPAPGVSPDDFSARWGGEVWLPAGEYRYSLTVDEGARLWIDGQLIVDEWHLATGETYLADLSLPEGVHVFLVEYFEATGSAYIHLSSEPTANRMQSP